MLFMKVFTVGNKLLLIEDDRSISKMIDLIMYAKDNYVNKTTSLEEHFLNILGTKEN